MKISFTVRNALFALPLVLAVASLTASADIICQGKTSSEQSIQVHVRDSDRSVTVQLDPIRERPSRQVYSEATNIWDGHKSGLITAPGLWMKYENHYGCYRRIEIGFVMGNQDRNFNYETADFTACRGGQTHDETCFGNAMVPVPRK